MLVFEAVSPRVALRVALWCVLEVPPMLMLGEAPPKLSVPLPPRV
jgi:hypothetical protein